MDRDESPVAFLSTMSHLCVSNTRWISSLKDYICPGLHGSAKDVCIQCSCLPDSETVLLEGSVPVL